MCPTLRAFGACYAECFRAWHHDQAAVLPCANDAKLRSMGLRTDRLLVFTARLRCGASEASRRNQSATVQLQSVMEGPH
jgi:hypothetical protein